MSTMFKTIIIITLILPYFAFAQSESDIELDLKVLIQTGEYQKIVDKYSTQVLPKTAYEYYYLAYAYYELKDNEKSEKWLKKALKKDEFNLDFIYLYGMIEYSKCNFVKALTYFEQVYNSSDSDITLLIQMANSYFSIKNNKAAINLYKLALTFDTCPDSIYIYLSKVYAYIYELDSASITLERFLKKPDKNKISTLESLYFLGQIKLEEKNYTTADSIFKKIIETNPSYFRAYTSLVYSYSMQDKKVENKSMIELLINLYLEKKFNTSDIEEFLIEKYSFNSNTIYAYTRIENYFSNSINKHYTFSFYKSAFFDNCIRQKYLPYYNVNEDKIENIITQCYNCLDCKRSIHIAKKTDYINIKLMAESEFEKIRVK